MDIFSGKKSGVVVGVGSPLVDMLIKGDEALLTACDLPKGGMVYVPSAKIDQVARSVATPPVMVTGGSACNTIFGLARLGIHGRFIGKRGADELGEFFENELRSVNIDPALLVSDSPTGRVLSIITPDAQRSMLTDLGASAELRPDEFTTEHFRQAAIVQLEGYLLFNRELIVAAMKAAKAAGALIALDLASHTVVSAQSDLIKGLTADYVDILIANEDEAAVYTGVQDERRAAELLAQSAPLAVLKLGGRGSLIIHGQALYRISPAGTDGVIDTTGAGDLWNSGFLYGLMQGYKPEICGKIGSACGYEVCRVLGAKIPESGWLRIKKLLSTLN